MKALSAIALLLLGGTGCQRASLSDGANSAETILLAAAQQNQQKSQPKERRCHLEYRNCWYDSEVQCVPAGEAQDKGANCQTVQVRRCGPAEMICEPN